MIGTKVATAAAELAQTTMSTSLVRLTVGTAVQLVAQREEIPTDLRGWDTTQRGRAAVVKEQVAKDAQVEDRNVEVAKEGNTEAFKRFHDACN